MEDLRIAGMVPTPRGAGQDLGPGDEGADDGILRWNHRTLLRRVTLPDGGTVIHKRALGLTAVARTRHEREVMERLAGVDAVPKLLPGGDDDTLVFEDIHAQPLPALLAEDELGGDVAAVCRLALGLARALGEIHAAGVIHRDLNPGSVLLSRDGDGELRPYLTDFDLATTLTQVRPSFVDPREIADRLPYLSPEQTGRSALPVDQRSDLYALGAVLYEIATGRPPFTDDDPLHLIGQILTRRPEPPDQLVPRLPAMFSRIVLRLLSKEPEARYSTTTGLVYDLAEVVDDPEAQFALGQRDFPLRLTAPARVIGRDRELAVLTDALDRAAAGSVQGVIVSGGAGVGKSALVEQLRTQVVGMGGWFTWAKADQYRNDATTSLFVDAMTRLATLLLAEPEDHLASLRDRMLVALGDNAGLIAALIPPFRRVLRVEPEDWQTLDPLETASVSARVVHASRDLLREVVSPQRPLVLLLDDLQWANARASQLIEGLLIDPDLSGLLVVGAFRDTDDGGEHPLINTVRTWGNVVRTHLRLGNLPPRDVADLVAEMLRISQGEAVELADILCERTDGNPYDTVELINALRQGGALLLGPLGWTWDISTIRQFVGTGDVVDLLTDRLGRLPDECRQELRTMAQLGSERPLSTLAAACGLAPDEVLDRLRPALDDGLVVADDGRADGTANGAEDAEHASVRFRHDRVQQAAHDSIPEDDPQGTALVLARRLAAVGDADAAAQQYLEVVDLLDDPAERRNVVALFQTVAEQAQRVNKYSFADQFLKTARRLHEGAANTAEDPIGLALDSSHHAVLCALGRLDEADAAFAAIVARNPSPIHLGRPGRAQISSLTVRGRQAEAVELGLGLLEKLGLPAPQGRGLGDAAAILDRAEHWLKDRTPRADAARTETSDPRIRAAAAVLKRLCLTARFSDRELLTWLVARSLQLWMDHGPQPDLVACLGYANSRITGLRTDAALDQRIVAHAIHVGRARGWDATTAEARLLYAGVLAHRSTPIENVVAELRDAREVLSRAGDLQAAGYSFLSAVSGLLDSGRTLESLQAEVTAATAMAQQAGNSYLTAVMGVYTWFLREMEFCSGDAPTAERPTPEDGGEDEGPRQTFSHHLLGSLRAVILGDAEELTRQVTAFDPWTRLHEDTYEAQQALFLTGFDAALRAGSSQGHEVVTALATLDAARESLHRSAVMAPASFEHLALLLDAERARAVGDVLGALRWYDRALAAADRVTRPWAHALTAERAGTLSLAGGFERTGRVLIAEARRRYRAWGATAKVRALDETYPWARRRERQDTANPGGRCVRELGIDTDELDMVAILAASQAIGSQTDPDRLRDTIVEQLGTLAGATDVLLVLPDECDTWYLQPGRRSPAPVEVEAAGERGLLPLGAFRVVERTREPLLVTDAAADPRFVRDRFVTAHSRCSLLVVPVMGGGSLHAVVVLVNHLTSGAFSTGLLDGVQLITGQLATSLENAHRFRTLEASVTSHAEALRLARGQLEGMSDPLTDVGNRLRFDQALTQEWERGRDHDRPVAVMMISIDSLAEYNEAHGHEAGDECLRSVAKALTSTVRASDVVSRYSDEEFAVILPRAQLWNAFTVAQRVQEAVRQLAIPHPGAHGRLTVSIGVAAAVPDGGSQPQQLVAAADAALYEAKNAGRDQVVALPAQHADA